MASDEYTAAKESRYVSIAKAEWQIDNTDTLTDSHTHMQSHLRQRFIINNGPHTTHNYCNIFVDLFVSQFITAHSQIVCLHLQAHEQIHNEYVRLIYGDKQDHMRQLRCAIYKYVAVVVVVAAAVQWSRNYSQSYRCVRYENDTMPTM